MVGQPENRGTLKNELEKPRNVVFQVYYPFMPYAETHSVFKVADPTSWVMYVSHERPKRLIVFVHGFGGRTLSTWAQFHQSGRIGRWWQQSDLLFVGYESERENPSSVADRLRRSLPAFYPIPFPPAMVVGDTAARDDVSSTYEELILVGHSLGGLVIRCALVQAAKSWVYGAPGTERPILLNAQTRLFSPANAGFSPAGLLGLAKELGFLGVAEIRLRQSRAYLDLQPESSLIAETRQLTEEFFEKTLAPALQAHILWANPDNVVKSEEYKMDIRDSADGQSHLSVCKPHDRYLRPWQFLERGV